MSLKPLATDWRSKHTPPSHNKECTIVRCDYVYPDGTLCGKLGCMTQYVDIGKDRALDPAGRPLYKTYWIMHSHFLKPTFEQRRNHNHYTNKKRRINTAKEGYWSFKLHHPDTIPQDILEQFERYD